MLTENPQLSIVIPTWNRSGEISRALESLIPIIKSGFAVEIIISDNASSDNTISVARDWSQQNDAYLTILESQHNAGPVLNWIKGIRHARAKYILLLFSDDLIQFSDAKDVKSFFLELQDNLNDKTALIRLPVTIVDQRLDPTPDPYLRLSHDNTHGRSRFSSRQSRLSFLANHLLPRQIKLPGIRRSFSPVSPTGYIIEKDILLETLIKFSEKRNYKSNGAGIDNLAILCAARSSPEVSFLSAPTSIMVASHSSITQNSYQSPKKALGLRLAYCCSELDFAIDSFRSNGHPFYLLLLLISYARLLKISFWGK